MKLGVDLDGTITANPEWFSVVTTALVRAGHEVHVITYREPDTREGVLGELRDLGVSFTGVHLPLVGEMPPEFKRRVAIDLGLDMMIDDAPEVLARMPASVLRLWVCASEVFDLDACVRALGEC